MAKNIFDINVSWDKRQQSIFEIATDFANLLFELSKIDNVFTTLVFSTENQKNVKFILNENKRENIVESIAYTILEFEKKDIRKYEKETNPTINYSRPFGFSFVATFYKNGKKCFSSIPKMGSDTGNGINISFGLNEYNVDFDWYFNVLKYLINNINALRGSVSLRGYSFTLDTAKYNRRLGWITYFSNESEIKIPNNLEGFEYEYTDKGKFLIATREDFTVSKEAYQEQKEKLLKTMEYLGKTVPGYLRSEEK